MTARLSGRACQDVRNAYFVGKRLCKTLILLTVDFDAAENLSAFEAVVCRRSDYEMRRFYRQYRLETRIVAGTQNAAGREQGVARGRFRFC
jgi:hypothetical protein